jgi:hypothetical protein
MMEEWPYGQIQVENSVLFQMSLRTWLPYMSVEGVKQINQFGESGFVEIEYLGPFINWQRFEKRNPAEAQSFMMLFLDLWKRIHL